ncbi:MAG: hypothetical protein J6I73_00855 [Treponema sp.]|nr:hypothetical protein [Treponema sp.]
MGYSYLLYGDEDIVTTFALFKADMFDSSLRHLDLYATWGYNYIVIRYIRGNSTATTEDGAHPMMIIQEKVFTLILTLKKHIHKRYSQRICL